MLTLLAALTACGLSAAPGCSAPVGCPTIASGGSWHSLALRGDGRVLAWGGGEIGQLGNGTRRDAVRPTFVDDGAAFSAVAAGGWHSLAVRGDGTVAAWGWNGEGQLGDGTTTNATAPVTVSGLSAIVAVAAGAWHSLALGTDGRVWAWGQNSTAQLGSGFRLPARVPGLVVAPDGTRPLDAIAAIAAGSNHSLALGTNGNVLAWGGNIHGQLGDGSTTPDSSLAVPISDITGATAIAAGVAHSLALLADGTVWAWGANGSGQLGNGTRNEARAPVQVTGVSTARAIAAGGYHSLALLADGTVVGWGHGGLGELGDGNRADATRPVAVNDLRDVVAIGAGRVHSLAITVDGLLSGWGFGEHGELGAGDTASAAAPVAVLAPCATCAVTVALGDQVPVDLGANVTLDAAGSAAPGCAGGLLFQWEEGTNVLRTFSSDPTFTFALTARGRFRVRVRCAANPGCEATSETVVTVLPESSCDIVAVAAGDDHSLALGADGQVWAWGMNDRGECGRGTTTPGSGEPVPQRVTALADVVAIAAGGRTSFALDIDGDVWAWGWNRYALFGDGTGADASIPIRVPGVHGVKSIAASGSHALALKRDGTVWGWGRHDRGQLDPTYGKDYDASLAVPAIGLPPMAEVAPGGDCCNLNPHSIGVAADGSVWGWGSDYYGALGDGLIPPWPFVPPMPVVAALPARITRVAAGSQHGLALDGSGRLWSWGGNVTGAVGRGLPDGNYPTPAVAGGNVAAIDANYWHSLFLRTDGTVWCFGFNAVGQCGNGRATREERDPVQVLGVADAVSVAMGNYHALALTRDGSVWTWGSNYVGQLGTGVTEPITVWHVAGKATSTWASTAPDVRANSLRAVRQDSNAMLTWDSSLAAARWNVYRSAAKTQLPAIWALPPLGSARATAYADPTPPAPSSPWLYQAFGADCDGQSVP